MSNPPTLLHVFPTFAVGGSQIRLATLANRFGRAFRHCIVSMDGRTGCRERLHDDLDVSFPEVRLQPHDTVGNAWRFRALLRSLSPSRLVTHNWGSIECAMANWPKLVDHVHIEDGFGPEEVRTQLRRRVLTRRYVLSRSTVVLPSQVLYRLASRVWKLDPARLHYIPNGIDCERFASRRLLPMAGLGTGPIVGTVAALRPEKNVMRLLEAFKKVRTAMSCRLLIAGDGPERVKLEHRASMLGIGQDVIFAGHITETERVYAALSVFALSSDTEQMPITVLEAMASGLPVVSTDVGDVAEMVVPENRAFVTPPDAESLAKAILQLLSAPKQATAIGAANREAVRERFNQEKMFASYEKVFNGTV
jgi:glycosyltransferase involved in cell wall biosynthesis